MSEPNTPLIEAPKKRGPIIVAVLVVLALVAALAYFLTRDSEEAGASTKVRIGIVSEGEQYWQDFVDAAADEGIDVELVNFANYELANPALANGEIDLNQFQHVVFLAQHNANTGDDLTPIGATAVYPLAMYSDKVSSPAEIKKGDKVVVPNDATNQARALLILESLDLITLKGGGNAFSTLADIDEKASRVKVTPVSAELTPTSIKDVAAVVINNDFVTKAGLDFDDAIHADDPKAESTRPYVNIFAARGEDKDNETYLKLVEIYQDDEKVQQGVLDASGGTANLLKTSAEDLQATLATVQADAEKAN